MHDTLVSGTRGPLAAAPHPPASDVGVSVPLLTLKRPFGINRTFLCRACCSVAGDRGPRSEFCSTTEHLQGAHVLHKGGSCAPHAGRCPLRGWQQGREQPSAHGTVHVVRRYEILVRGEQAGGTGGVARQGHLAAPPDRGRSNIDTQNAGATPGGTRASTANKEGHSKAGEATRTAGTGNQNGADGRACAWEAATIKGMAWPTSPVATGCQGNPCSTGIRWGVSPAAQMGCLGYRSGSPSGADQP